MRSAGAEHHSPQSLADPIVYSRQVSESQREHRWRIALGAAFFILVIILWEWFGRVYGGLLFAPFSETAVALFEVVRSGTLAEAFYLSNQTMIAGYFLGALIAVPFGFLLARSPFIETIADPYLNILIVIPVAAIVPLVIVFVGLGTAARVLIVFLFCFPVIAINARAGLRKIESELIDMGRSFLCSERQLWQHILLPIAFPAVMGGLRLGLGRALSAMVVVELLFSGVGLGKLILEETARFEPARVYAVILVIILEAVLLMSLLRYLQRRLAPWSLQP